MFMNKNPQIHLIFLMILVMNLAIRYTIIYFSRNQITEGNDDKCILLSSVFIFPTDVFLAVSGHELFATSITKLEVADYLP